MTSAVPVPQDVSQPEHDLAAPTGMRAGFAPATPKEGQLCHEELSGTCQGWLLPRGCATLAVPRCHFVCPSVPLSLPACASLPVGLHPNWTRRDCRSRSSSKGALPSRNKSATRTIPSNFNAMGAGLSSRPKGTWDLYQVLICSALGEIPACIFVDAEPHPAAPEEAEPSSWGHHSAGPDLPCHPHEQTGGFLLLPQGLGRSVLNRGVRDAFT